MIAPWIVCGFSYVPTDRINTDQGKPYAARSILNTRRRSSSRIGRAFGSPGLRTALKAPVPGVRRPVSDLARLDASQAVSAIDRPDDRSPELAFRSPRECAACRAIFQSASTHRADFAQRCDPRRESTQVQRRRFAAADNARSLRPRRHVDRGFQAAGT